MIHQMVVVRAQVFVLGLVIALVAGCSKDGNKRPVVGPVGVVVALDGEATAQRGQQAARPLAMDDIIYAKDTISLADGASLEIEFDGVAGKWALAGPAEKHVSTASAWDAVEKRWALMARAESEGNRGGGAHGEKTAGSAANEIMKPQTSDENTPLTEVSEEEGGERKSDPADNKPVDTPEKRPVKTKPVTPPPPPPPPLDQPRRGKLKVELLQGTKLKPGGGKKDNKAQAGDHAVVTAVKKRSAAVLACAATGNLLITVQMSSGTARVTTTSGELGDCVVAALGKLKVPSAANTTVLLTLRW